MLSCCRWCQKSCCLSATQTMHLTLQHQRPFFAPFVTLLNKRVPTSWCKQPLASSFSHHWWFHWLLWSYSDYYLATDGKLIWDMPVVLPLSDHGRFFSIWFFACRVILFGTCASCFFWIIPLSLTLVHTVPPSYLQISFCFCLLLLLDH